MLFGRSPHGLRLTPAGAVLRERAKALIETEAQARQELKAYRGRLVPALRFYVLDSIAVHLVDAILPELTESAERVEMMSGRSLTHVRDFVTGEIDLLISSNDFLDLPDLERHLLCSQTLIGIAPVTTPSNHLGFHQLAETLPLIRARKSSRIDDLVQTYVEGQGLDLPRIIECSSPATVISLIAAGHGWTIATPLTISWFRDHWTDLAWVPLPGAPIERLFLVSLADRFLDLPAKPPTEAHDLTYIPVASEGMYIFGSRQGPELPDRMMLSEMSKLPLILTGKPTLARLGLEKTADASGVGLEVVVEIESQAIMKDLVNQRMGFGVVPFSSLYDEIERFTVARLEGVTMTRMLARRTNRPPTRATMTGWLSLFRCVDPQ